MVDVCSILHGTKFDIITIFYENREFGFVIEQQQFVTAKITVKSEKPVRFVVMVSEKDSIALEIGDVE